MKKWFNCFATLVLAITMILSFSFTVLAYKNSKSKGAGIPFVSDKSDRTLIKETLVQQREILARQKEALALLKEIKKMLKE